MRTWVYPAAVTRHGDDDFIVVFRDVPEAVTGGATRAEALANAADALEEAILAYMAGGRAIPSPSDAKRKEESVILDPVTAARAALAGAMRDKRVSNVSLANALGKSEGAVRRLTDGSTVVKLDTVLDAMRALGARAFLSTAVD